MEHGHPVLYILTPRPLGFDPARVMVLMISGLASLTAHGLLAAASVDQAGFFAG
ncbi:MAG: hypothetical protein H7222_18275 [Methylotenera sp.]|nr:hypothetical protein [Oligoflexia bacterium]